MDGNERLKGVITALNLKQKDFAEKVGINPSHVSSYLSGRLPLGMTLLESIKSAFPQVDLNWLLTGQGDVFVPVYPPGSKELVNELNYYKSRCEDLEEDLAKLVVKYLGSKNVKVNYETFKEDLKIMVNEKIDNDYKT